MNKEKAQAIVELNKKFNELKDTFKVITGQEYPVPQILVDYVNYSNGYIAALATFPTPIDEVK